MRKWGLYLVVVLVAVAVRVPFLDYRSGDYIRYLGPWSTFIETHGGFRALEHEFSNYNAPYLCLMAAASYLPWSSLLSVKLISLGFELLLAWNVHRLLALRHPTGHLPLLGAAVVLVLPTVVLNGAMWGQADSTYAALCVAGLYHLLRRRPVRSGVYFGVALAFKLQAVFIFPALLLFALRRELPLRALAMIPVTYLLLDVPAIMLGADWRRLLLVYLRQTGADTQLTVNAPSIYALLDLDPALRRLCVLGAGVILLALVAIAVRAKLTDERMVLYVAASALLTPYLLPSMHERYFYLAEVLTVLAAFWRPVLLPVPVLLQVAAVSTYLNYFLRPRQVGDLRVLAVLLAVAIGVLLGWLLTSRPAPDEVRGRSGQRRLTAT
ncbi:glycosyltransferase 87 family protein [Kribbella sp. NPDC003505]|uniref:glycosyltransferase 87 family protein n=1 Tax=Kribbella sp. NPDC003505 TaxID=3154448 RepID=UPI0033AB57B0